MRLSLSAFVIAGTHSGVGKTTITLGLLAAFRRRGLRVQPFKVGPDFIDPGLHQRTVSVPSYNLDGWMLTKDFNRRTFLDNSGDKDVAIVEGVMGLFDGYDGRSNRGSTAEMAKWLGLPVVLVVDASAMARSAAAMVLGYLRFDLGLRVVGIIFNRIGGKRHLEYLKEAMTSLPDILCFGGLPYNDEIRIPERHLGLMTAEEGFPNKKATEKLPGWIESNVNLDRLLRHTRLTFVYNARSRANTRQNQTGAVSIGVAQDKAFCFYYPDNLDLLRQAGAQLEPFSPLSDSSLPCGIQGLYLGGGYPELHARQLSSNRSMRNAIRAFVENGGIVYAECGGFMYLTKALIDERGKAFPMVGVYPYKTKMAERLKALGYQQVKVRRGCFVPAGLNMRGHEFHYSELVDIEKTKQVETVYAVSSGKGRQAQEGYRYKNCLASYIHLHFGSNPEFASGLVSACRLRAA